MIKSEIHKNSVVGKCLNFFKTNFEVTCRSEAYTSEGKFLYIVLDQCKIEIRQT